MWALKQDMLPSSHLPGGDIPPGPEEIMEATSFRGDDDLLKE